MVLIAEPTQINLHGTSSIAHRFRKAGVASLSILKHERNAGCTLGLPDLSALKSHPRLKSCFQMTCMLEMVRTISDQSTNLSGNIKPRSRAQIASAAACA